MSHAEEGATPSVVARTSDRPIAGLDLFHAMYVIGLAFGLEETATALYRDAKNWLFGAISIVEFLGDALLFASILFLVVRFFWSVGNIRRAITRAGHQKMTNFAIMLVHLPWLLMQGMLVLFLCISFREFVAGETPVLVVFLTFAAATAWNAAWLLLLLRGTPAAATAVPERFWLRNNVFFVAVFLAVATAHAWSYVGDAIAIVVFAVAALGNSVLDLHRTSEHYVQDAGQ